MVALLVILTTLLFAEVASVTLRGDGNCVSGEADVVITVPYEDYRGNRRLANYNVPSNAKYNVSCKDSTLSTKKASILIRFNRDILQLDFTAPAVLGNDISLAFVNYTYYKDSARFNGVKKEGYATATQTYPEKNTTVGKWKTVYKCKDLALRLPGGTIIELRSLRLAIFRVKESKDVVTCPKPDVIDNYSFGSGTLQVTVPTGSDRVGHAKAGGSDTVGNFKNGYPQASLAVEKCSKGFATIFVNCAYRRRDGSNNIAAFAVPRTAKVSGLCRDPLWRRKTATIVLKWDEDIMALNFSAHGGLGNDVISLTGVNYTFVQDSRRFPQIAFENVQSVSRSYEDDEFPIGEWGKNNSCGIVQLDLGGGLRLEIRDFNLAIFKLAAKDVKSCPVRTTSWPTFTSAPVDSGKFGTTQPSRFGSTRRTLTTAYRSFGKRSI